jgi:hypothetical protein
MSFKGSERVPVLPPIINSQNTSSLQEMNRQNPFIMPPDTELFILREKERKNQKEDRSRERKLPVHEKSTYTSRMNARLSSLRKTILSPDDTHADIKGFDQATRLHEDTQFVLSTTRGKARLLLLVMCTLHGGMMQIDE